MLNQSTGEYRGIQENTIEYRVMQKLFQSSVDSNKSAKEIIIIIIVY